MWLPPVPKAVVAAPLKAEGAARTLRGDSPHPGRQVTIHEHPNSSAPRPRASCNDGDHRPTGSLEGERKGKWSKRARDRTFGKGERTRLVLSDKQHQTKGDGRGKKAGTRGSTRHDEQSQTPRPPRENSSAKMIESLIFQLLRG